MEPLQPIEFVPAPTISSKKSNWAFVDDQGRLVLPPEMADRFGLVPGAQVRFEPTAHGLRLHRPITHLAKLRVPGLPPTRAGVWLSTMHLLRWL